MEKSKVKRKPRNIQYFALTALICGAIALWLGWMLFNRFVQSEQWIVYVADTREGGEIMRVNALKPEEIVNLTRYDGLDDMPAVAPDGKRIAFTSWRDSNMGDIYLMDADGNNVINITNTPSLADAYPAWSPDGKQIAFISNRNGGLHIYVMNADGTDARQLTSGRAIHNEAAWSPDGTQIAFTAGEGLQPDIFVMNADGSNPQNISQSPDLAERNIVWSPNGTQMVFAAASRGTDGNFSGDGDIYLLTLATGEVKQLTDHPEGDETPTWSGDGEWIIFSSQRDWGGGQLYKMRPDGTEPQRITITQNVSEKSPVWLGNLR